MLIPIRCVTCGNMIGSKYKKYLKNKRDYEHTTTMVESQVLTFDKPNTDIYNTLMENTGIKLYCCKRHFLGQQEIIYKM